MLAIQPKRIKVWIRLHFLCLCALLELAASLCRDSKKSELYETSLHNACHIIILILGMLN